jgi:hypothetical protein
MRSLCLWPLGFSCYDDDLRYYDLDSVVALVDVDVDVDVDVVVVVVVS